MKLPAKNLFALILALVLWGSSFPAMKLAVNTNPPMVVLFYRYLFAFAIVFFIFLGKYREKAGELFTCKELFLLGVFNFLGSVLQFSGIAKTSSTKSAILTQLMVVVVPVFAYFLLKERISLQKVAAILLSLGGAILLSTNLNFTGLWQRSSVVGDLLNVLAVVFWALFIVYTRKLTQKRGAFWLLLANVSVVFPLSGLAVVPGGSFSISLSGIAISLFLAVFCTILPTLLYNFALRAIDATTSAIIGPIEIVSAVVLSMVFLGERLTKIGLVGAVLILGSIYIVDLQKR